MATENSQPKQAAKQDKDAPSIEVKEEVVAKPAAKEESKPAAAPAAKKEEPKPAVAPAAAAPAAKKEEPKPAVAPAAAAAPAAKKEEPKPAAAPAPKPSTSGPRPVDTISRVGRAEAIVRRNVLWSVGAGVIPLPIFDAVATAGIQLKMLAELSELYNVPFKEELAKKLVGSLMSSLGGVALGTVVGISVSKLIPVVGSALGIVSVPIIGGAFTHATGKVFVMHFEAGGTLLDFDPHKMRTYFKQEFEKAKQTVAEMHKEEKAKTN